MESLFAGSKRRNDRRAGRRFAVALCFLVIPAWAGMLPPPVSLTPPEVFQGGIVKISVSGESGSEVSGHFSGRKITFFPAEGGVYFALLGVDLEQRPGPLEILLKGKGKGGESWEKPILVRIKEQSFPREELSVPPSFDRIDEATRKRIEKEQAVLDRLWPLATPRRLWEGSFIRPVAGGISSPFGLRRVINGLPRSPHAGIDLKAALGTEIRAANHGQVVLKEEFFFSGKSVVLDHGAGLYTMYYHLSDFGAEKNAVVRKGEVVGWAGMSGRVTGPHLHWGARLNGARVDPLELLDGVGVRP